MKTVPTFVGTYVFRKSFPILVIHRAKIIIYSVLIILILPACSQQVNITVSFGGRDWPIRAEDFNIGPIAPNMPNIPFCYGSVVNLDLVNLFGLPDPIARWVFGTTFLVRLITLYYHEP